VSPSSQIPLNEASPCPVCGDVVPPEVECPKCGWTCGHGILESDPRYLVMYSLVQRAVAASTHMKGDSWSVFLRIRPGAREYAVLEVDDHIVSGGIYWRITEKERGIFWMRGSEIVWKPGAGLRLKNPVAESEPEWVRQMRAKVEP
jgi:hypothetical protein